MLRGAERIWPPSVARAQRGRMERGAAKWRGRGLGQRNIKIKKSLPQIKTWPTTICFIFFLWLHCLAVKNQF